MNIKMINAAHVWKQMEDVLVVRLRFSVLDRSIYSHLLRHSRLEGKPRLRFSIQWLARAVRVSGGPVRESRAPPRRFRRVAPPSAAIPIATSSPAASSATRKGANGPRDFLHWLYREQRLTTLEFENRLRALDDLAAGKLRPYSEYPPAISRSEVTRNPSSRPLAPRGLSSLPPPRPRTQNVSPPPGGPANPFPRKGRPCKTPLHNRLGH